MPRLDKRAFVLPVVLALSAVSAATLSQSPPWPRGEPPSSEELGEDLAEAGKLFERERAEEFLEASEKGEDSEHIFILQDEIDGGTVSLERLFTIGDATFEHEFRLENGYGDAAHDTHSRRVHRGAYGGRDTFSCAGCHSEGGVNGAGAAPATSYYFGDGERVSSAVARNPPAVLGVGLVQALAAEMSRDLALARERALTEAKTRGAPATVELASKGVRFGSLTARPDGGVDLAAVEGVDGDLRVKPFGWKGHTARLRRFAERAARLHFGVQTHVLALEHRLDPDPATLGWGPWWDPDRDGVSRELEEGTLTALAVYLAMLETPRVIPPAEPDLLLRWSRGSALFDRIGCSECHRRELALTTNVWFELPDTSAGAGVRIDLSRDGERPRPSSGRVPLFSDLKRHHMGDKLREPNDDPDGIGRDVFLTRPLWGAAETAPYLHDGRAASFAEAIREHGGEAETQRASFDALAEDEQRDLAVFLSSLGREPRLRVER